MTESSGSKKKISRNRVGRGIELTIAEFQRAYCLSEEEAKRIFGVAGPSSINLHALMKAKTERRA